MSFGSDNSLASIGVNAGIPSLNTADIPANVRNGNAEAKQAYTEGLAFEQVLVNELTTQLSNSMGSGTLDPSSDSSDGSDSSGGLLGGSSASGYSSLISSTLSSSIMSGGGLGMADQFAAAIDPSINDPSSSSSSSGSSTDVSSDGATGGKRIMNMVQTQARTDAVLATEILNHLETQLGSARRMLAIVVEQGMAIRQREVPAIVRLAGALQAEMHRREVLEIERTELMRRAALKLDVSAEDVTMAMLTRVMDEESARLATSATAALRGMLGDIQREHDTNRALMQQELAFLDHLLRLAGSAGGYDSAGDRISNPQAHSIDAAARF